MSSAVTISRRAVERIAGGHPWIYRSDLVQAGKAEPGEVVRVRDARGHCHGRAHYSNSSEIALRLLTVHDRPVDRVFYQEALLRSRARREPFVQESDAYRLVFGEADGLPALIVDRYAGWLVIQTLNQGMDRDQATIVELLREMYPEFGIVERNDASVRRLEKLPLRTGVLHGPDPKPEIKMNGLRFEVDLLKGQKTGAFLDQRENYLAAAGYARGRVLDCFSYAGAFALHLARTTEHVEAVDSSAEALETAKRNAARNGAGNISFTEANVFDMLKSSQEGSRFFDAVVLDPPAFARTRAQVEGALRGYKEINLRAMKLLRPGGMLVTCTCSHHVGEADFLETIAAAAIDARRQATVLERRTQSRDHPILLTVPETFYLKCVILRVEPRH